MRPRPPIALLDQQLQAAGLQGVPEWYIRALRDPSVTLVDGRPKEEFLPFSPQSMEYPIQQQWAASGNAPVAPSPRPAPLQRRPPARRGPVSADLFPPVPVEMPGLPAVGYGGGDVPMDSLLTEEEAAANPVYDDPDTGSRLDAGLYANLPGEPNDPDRRTRADAGLYANLPALPVDADRGTKQDAGLYANLPPMPVSSDGPMTPAELEDMYRNRASLPPAERARMERLHAESVAAGDAAYRGSPTSLDPNEAAAVEIKPDQELPPAEQPKPAAPERPAAPTRAEREDWVTRRTNELVRRGRPLTYRDAAMSPEVARAQAEAEYDDPNGWKRNPNSEQSRSPQVKAAVRRQLDIEAAQRAEATRASLGGGTPRFNSADFQRQRAEEEAAKEAAAQKKWDDWATGGSYERMARYAPEEYRLRMEAASEQRRKENLQEYLNRYDFEVDPKTGMTKGKLYRMAQNQEDKEQLRRTDPQANAILRRELQRMGVDTEPFESNTPRPKAGETESTTVSRNRNFDRTNALAAKSEAKNARFAAADQAVKRRAQARQNPLEYAGRSDITDGQRRTMQFWLANGRGPTANEVEAINAQQFLEGAQQGARQNINVNNQEAAVRLGQEQADRQRGEAAVQAADTWHQNNIGYMPGYRSWDQSAYNDMVGFLQGPPHLLSPEQAAKVASRFGPPKRSKAERTAPPAGR